ncbi:MAG: GspH/FimT family pseudopilin [Acidobacteriota bacterium]
MRVFSKPKSSWRADAGLGLMEAIVGLLVVLIVASLLLHLGRMGFAMYKLNAATGGIAEELELARAQAIERRVSVSVIFDAKGERFGLDRNGNGRLDSVEAEELPAGVEVSEDATVIFARSGNLAPGSKQPNIVISNTTKSRRVSVSKSGAIEID